MVVLDIPEGVAPLTDVDAIGGLLCDPCLARGQPPHYDYLRELLRTNFAITGDEYVLVTIAMYAYSDFEEHCLSVAVMLGGAIVMWRLQCYRACI